MLNAKQGSCESQFSKVFGLIRHGNRTRVYRFRGRRSIYYANWSVNVSETTAVRLCQSKVRRNLMISICNIGLTYQWSIQTEIVYKTWSCFIRMYSNYNSLFMFQVFFHAQLPPHLDQPFVKTFEMQTCAALPSMHSMLPFASKLATPNAKQNNVEFRLYITLLSNCITVTVLV